jgi:hypothetical protein
VAIRKKKSPISNATWREWVCGLRSGNKPARKKSPRNISPSDGYKHHKLLRFPFMKDNKQKGSNFLCYDVFTQAKWQ